jgi:GNAT superfamily N-acetyltransferase
MTRIVPATAADVPTILELIKGLAAYERLAHEVVATEADLQAALFGARPFAEVILAKDGDEPVGFALFFHNYSTFLGRPGLYLEDLFVRPDRRGRGIGRQLLAALARLAVERGCGRLEWSVLDWNAPAIGFYERMGARLLHEWRICRLTGEALVRAAES